MDFSTFLLYFIAAKLIYTAIETVIMLIGTYIVYKLKARKLKKKLGDPEVQKALASLLGEVKNAEGKKTWN